VHVKDSVCTVTAATIAGRVTGGIICRFKSGDPFIPLAQNRSCKIDSQFDCVDRTSNMSVLGHTKSCGIVTLGALSFTLFLPDLSSPGHSLPSIYVSALSMRTRLKFWRRRVVFSLQWEQFSQSPDVSRLLLQHRTTVKITLQYAKLDDPPCHRCWKYGTR